MSSHPAYPSNSQLREESLADALLAEQAASVATFQRALAVFSATFDALHFPLGCPVRGYDLEDINGHLADWILLRDDDTELANELAAEANDNDSDETGWRGLEA